MNLEKQWHDAERKRRFRLCSKYSQTEQGFDIPCPKTGNMTSAAVRMETTSDSDKYYKEVTENVGKFPDVPGGKFTEAVPQLNRMTQVLQKYENIKLKSG